MIKAIIFDLNGIFIQSPKLSSRFEEDFGIPKEDFLEKLERIVAKTRKPGAGPSFVYWSPVLKEWGLKMNEQEFWDYWFKAEKPSEWMIQFSRDLKGKNIKVFILSNNFKERAEYYNHYPWLHEVVDRVYFSWETGFIKTDQKSWQLILDENNLEPEECLYFDDQKKNVEAAESLKIKSFLFTSEGDLERQINLEIARIS
ncbi:MAG: HAD-IA family hydrolase [Patescibacteria group bacterium]